MSSAAAQHHRQSYSREYIESLVDRLLRLAEQSDPSGAQETALGKDLRAFEALQTAGDLVTALAGWAVSHTCGIAAQGLGFVPLQPTQTKSHPEYIIARSRVDSHEHELARFDIGESSEPRIARKMLINLLKGNSRAWPSQLLNQFTAALEGLEFGEISPLLQPIKKGRKAGLAELRCQLCAVCFAEYQRALGMTKRRATEIVAAAFGVDRETVISWEKRLRKELSQLEISRSIAFARNAASYKKSGLEGNGDLLYGDTALRDCAKKYKDLIYRQT